MIKPLILAFQFLTRLNINVCVDMSDTNVRRSIGFYPTVGAFIGALIYFVGFAARKFDVNFYIISFLQLIAWVFITGGMHLDGVADMADGFYSNRSRGRVQEIMRDSSIGVFGVVAIIFVMLGKYCALLSLNTVGDLAVIFAPIFGRFASLVVIVTKPLALGSKMGEMLHRTKPVYALIINTILIFATALYLNPMILIAFATAVVAEELLAHKSISVIGGVTGDIYGATVEIAELVALLVLQRVI